MIRVVIIEDEAPARKKLRNFLSRLENTTEVIIELESVADSIKYFQTLPDTSLIFSDIELRDGNVFELFKEITVSCPIIFITAYDQFWMNAFETNGIEYLLKPFSFERFKKAWNKYLTLKPELTNNHNNLLKELEQFYQEKSSFQISYSEYIPIKSKANIYFLKVEDIAFIQSDYGVIFAYDAQGKKHLMNETSLKEVEQNLNPAKFFKINRSELVNRNHIEKLNRYSKNSLAIYFKDQKQVLKTSQSNTAAFNAWLGL